MNQGPMAIVAEFDVHRAQITLDVLDTETGEVTRGRIDATPAAVTRWVERLEGEIDVAVGACTGWLFVCGELVAAGAVAHLVEPVETRALRGCKRRVKTGREDARWRRELLADPRVADDRAQARAQLLSTSCANSGPPPWSRSRRPDHKSAPRRPPVLAPAAAA